MVSGLGPVTAEQVNAVESYREKWAEFATFGPFLVRPLFGFPVIGHKVPETSMPDRYR